ncbi:hypothetical protein ACSQ67_016639 [Phaseolus vulgaris]
MFELQCLEGKDQMSEVYTCLIPPPPSSVKCEKRLEKDKIRIEEEPLWTMYYNGKKNGYDMQREVSDEDLCVMELLKAVSMGVSVLPSRRRAVAWRGRRVGVYASTIRSRSGQLEATRHDGGKRSCCLVVMTVVKDGM